MRGLITIALVITCGAFAFFLSAVSVSLIGAVIVFALRSLGLM